MKPHEKYLMSLAVVIFGCVLLWVDSACVYGANGDKLWPSDGVAVVETTGDQKNFDVCSDGAGGVFVVWQSDANYDGLWNIYVQRMDANGNQVWASPVLLSNAGINAQKPAIAAPESGYAIAAWISGSPGKVYAQRIDSSGILQWASAVQLTNSCYIDHGLDMTEGVNNGAFVVFTATNVHVVHVHSDGTLTYPGIDGIDLGAVPVDPPVIDSIGVTSFGAFVTFNKSNAGNEDIVAQYIFRAMTYIPGQGFSFYLDLPWGDTPVTISDDAREEQAYSIAVDSNNNALIAWYGYVPTAALTSQIRVQKINPDGVCQWTADGVVVLSSSVAAWRTYAYTVSTTVISDGSGGAIAAWSDWRNEPSAGFSDDIYAQRVYSAGTIAWPVNGAAVRSQIGAQRLPKMVSDGNGGGVITWEDHTAFGPDIRAARLNSDSSQQWAKVIFQDGWPGNPGGRQENPQVVLDVVNNPCPPGSIILWLDTRTEEGDYYDILAQKVETTLNFPAGDFDYTGCEDLDDYVIFSRAWLSSSGGANWNAHCDISPTTDGVINLLDLAEFAKDWLLCECP